jgi:hypothetical protein
MREGTIDGTKRESEQARKAGEAVYTTIRKFDPAPQVALGEGRMFHREEADAVAQDLANVAVFTTTRPPVIALSGPKSWIRVPSCLSDLGRCRN